jgi:hypothetical protein
MVPFEQMAAYLSAQVNALRYFSATSAQPRDHWGFAWAPRNTTGLSPGDFTNQTGALIDRLAAAIRDSGDVVDPENPGSGACGPGETLCALDYPEARHNEAWRSFRAWAQSTLSIGAAPTTLVAGVASPLELSLASTVARPATAVTLRSSSPAGAFSASPAGPWTSTLTLSVAPGTNVAFYYRDTRAGKATLTASAPATAQAVREVAIVAGAAVQVALSPTTVSVKARGQRRLTAIATDSFGNAAPLRFTWTVSPGALGVVTPGSNGTATFTAGRTLGTGTITASAGGLTASASVGVSPANMLIRSIRVTASTRGLRVLVGVVDGARRPISKAALRLVVRKNGRPVFSGTGVTGSGGKVLFRVRVGQGCFSATIDRAKAQGFRWTGPTPGRSLCRR